MSVDLLLAGSPCQGFSKAGNQLNFDHPKSRLFFEFVEALRILKPKYWMLENVKMKKEWQDVITEILGVEPIRINSNLVSAQRRDRLYWTNIPGVQVPDDRGILLESVIDDGDVDKDKAYCIDANYFKGTNARQYLCKKRRKVVWKIPEATKKGYVEVTEGECIDLTFIKSKTRRGRLMIEKSNCLTASNYNYCKVTNDWFRLLTPLECERLQTVPEGYTDVSVEGKKISNTQRYKMLGNGWTIDVIAHILSYIPENSLGNIVSLFDGMSGGQMSIDRCGKTYVAYYASEIDKSAMAVTMANYPRTIQIGNVESVDWRQLINEMRQDKSA